MTVFAIDQTPRSNSNLNHDIPTDRIVFKQAQQLNQAITSASKLFGTDHTIILSVSTSFNTDDTKSFKCDGFIKYGTKNLYFYKKDGSIKQSNPMCLLDFYVDQPMQRHGIGLTLFQKMIEVQYKMTVLFTSFTFLSM